MKTTMHICDRCKKTGPAGKLKLYEISVEVKQSYSPNTALRAEWCVDCVTSKIAGWVVGVRPSPPEPDPKPTIDDVIREMIQEVIDEQ